ncbi:MAG: nuclear transport factor 2 family protein [Gemmatimonadota bacterium]
MPARAGAQSATEEEVRSAVRAFYASYNAHEFSRFVEYTTEDCVHVTPNGIARHGRAAVLEALNQVHSTFLKGVTDTPEGMMVRLATPEVAVRCREAERPLADHAGSQHRSRDTSVTKGTCGGFQVLPLRSVTCKRHHGRRHLRQVSTSA